MTELKYSRPAKMKKALKLLDKGDPLAGGTAISGRLAELSHVVDVQDLGLDTITVMDDYVKVGAAVKLQRILNEVKEPSGSLAKACRLEAGLNMRWMSSIAGTIVEAKGRSPLVTALLVMGTHLELEPDAKLLPLEKFLKNRKKLSKKRFITAIQIRIPVLMAFEYVARSPVDRPLVCAAAATIEKRKGKGVFVALGGYGDKPVRVSKAEKAITEKGGLEHAAEAAAMIYETAEDAFASSAYRSNIAAVLVQRVLKEVII